MIRHVQWSLLNYFNVQVPAEFTDGLSDRWKCEVVHPIINHLTIVTGKGHMPLFLQAAKEE
jgi:hypothetical protein